jgi:hypothetical protein
MMPVFERLRPVGRLEPEGNDQEYGRVPADAVNEAR